MNSLVYQRIAPDLISLGIPEDSIIVLANHIWTSSMNSPQRNNLCAACCVKLQDKIPFECTHTYFHAHYCRASPTISPEEAHSLVSRSLKKSELKFTKYVCSKKCYLGLSLSL